MNRRRFLQSTAHILGGALLWPWLSIIRTYAGQKIVTWQSIPLTTSRMRELGIPGGDGFQYVHALIYANSDPSVAYLSVDQSGIWRSDDGGKSWLPKFKGFLAYGARSVAVDPFNPQIVLAAGFLGFRRGDAMKYPKRHQGIYLTRDGGETWHMVRKTDFFKQSSKGQLFLFQPSIGSKSTPSRCLNVWCASASEGLLMSMDGGHTWQSTSCTDTHIHDLALIGKSQAAVLAASTQGLFHIENDKLKKIGRGLPDFPRSIATSLAAPQKVYAALGKKGVAVSDDQGLTFRPLKQFLVPPLDITDIAISPVDAERVYIRANRSSRPPYSSSDGGRTWKAPEVVDPEQLLGNPGFYFSSPFAPHPTDPLTCLHVTNGRARIIRTDNGGRSWHFSGSGFTGARMIDIIFLSAEHMIFCLTDHGLWETFDRGRTFRELDVKRIGGAKSVSAGSSDGRTIVVGVGPWGEKGLAVSHNAGKYFTCFPDLKDRFYFIGFHPSIHGLVYAGPFRSSDSGRNWQRLPETISAMSTDGSRLYALGTFKKYRTRILVSHDKGNSFTQELELDIPVRIINQIVVSPLGTIFLATSRGIYRIENEKVELHDHRHGLAKDAFGSMYTQCVAYDPNQPARIFVGRRALGFGNGNGVFLSLDNGNRWQSANYNLSPGVTVFAVRINPFDSSVYIGTSFGTHRLEPYST